MFLVVEVVAQMVEVLGEGESSVLARYGKTHVNSPKLCIHPTEYLYFQIMLSPAWH